MTRPMCNVASDLQPVHYENCIVKFADDTYLIVPAVDNCFAELVHIKDWANNNSLHLNCAKTKKIVFRVKRKRSYTRQVPPPRAGIERVSSLTLLGVDRRMTAADQYVSGLLMSSSLYALLASILYVLRVLRRHGISSASMNDVFIGQLSCMYVRLPGRVFVHQQTVLEWNRFCVGVNDSATTIVTCYHLVKCLTC